MATTREKVAALVDHLRTMPPSAMSPEGRQLAEGYQIVAGLGFDPLPLLLPDSDAEADVLVDNLIGLLLEIRGDDLPPFDVSRYGELEGELEGPASPLELEPGEPPAAPPAE